MSDTPINNGGPAFPVAWILRADGRPYSCPEVWGMSLRDYFAAQAMQALTHGYDRAMRAESTEPGSRTWFDNKPWMDSETTYAELLAEYAYIIADKMLAARGVKS